MSHYLLSKEEQDEIFDDRCEAFEGGYISEEIFKSELADLGYNAKDIEDIVKFYRPKETDDGP